MFYKMIENKCTQWYESERCTVKNLIEYIEKTGQMRDAQIEAIKVYLFLKIACETGGFDVTAWFPEEYFTDSEGA